jgi:hypothetical protein
MEDKKKSLEIMAQVGEAFEAQSKNYTILPVKLKEMPELKKDNLDHRPNGQGFNLLINSNAELLNKWLGRKFMDSDNKPMSIEKIASDDWDTDDLSTFIRHLYKISG